MEKVGQIDTVGHQTALYSGGTQCVKEVFSKGIAGADFTWKRQWK